MQPKKILVISLTRKGGGFEQYTNAILEHFTLPFTIYQSAFVSDEVKRKDARFIVTYKGKVSFVFSSIFIAPLLFCIFALRLGVIMPFSCHISTFLTSLLSWLLDCVESL